MCKQQMVHNPISSDVIESELLIDLKQTCYFVSASLFSSFWSLGLSCQENSKTNKKDKISLIKDM